MKKILYCIGCALLVCFLAGCQLSDFGPKQPTEEEKKYEVYLLASSSGYTGTYEQWLETIKGVDGTSIVNVHINTSGELVITLSDGVVKNLGKVTGNDGQDGVSILSIITNSQGEVIVYLSDGSNRNLGKITSSDTVSIKTIELVDGELIVELTDGSTNNLGKITVTTENDVTYIVDVYTNYNNKIVVKYSDGTEKIIGNSDGSDPTQYFTVSFDTGTDVYFESQQVAAHEKAQNPGEPYKPGYKFDGWYVGEEKWSFIGYLVTEDIHLVAKWVPCEYYTIDFIVQSYAEVGEIPTIEHVMYGDSIVLPSFDDKLPFEFSGWMDANTGTLYKYDKNADYLFTCTGNTTLVAVWETLYTLIYPNGNVETYVVQHGYEFALPTDENVIGWTADHQNIIYGSVNEYYNNTYYAVSPYTITYSDENGNILLTEEIKSYYDYDATLPTPERYGYIFDGWYDEKYEYQYYTKPIFESTLYANFQKGAQVNFDLNGGEFEGKYSSIAEFGEEIVTLFKEAGSSDTTKENFQNTSHPNVKYVFSNYDNLVKYKWLFEYSLEAVQNGYNSGVILPDGTYEEMFEMLPRLINGDVDAINGNYPNGRTCLRQFIHRIINMDDLNCVGNSAYDPIVPSYSDPTEVAKIESILLGFNGNFIYGDELPIPTKYGTTFIGWEDPYGDIVVGNYYPGDDVTLKAIYGYSVNYFIQGDGELEGTFTSCDEIKDEFINDINTYFGTSYTKESNFIWNSDLYKFFLDKDQLAKWGRLLQYLVDIEEEYCANIDYTTHPDKTTSSYFGIQYWIDLENGTDIAEVYGNNTAPYCVSYTVQSWLRSYHYIGTYYHGASFESEEIQNRVLEYYRDNTYLLVPEGETIVLPYVEYFDSNTFLNWTDNYGNVYLPHQEIVIDRDYIFYDLYEETPLANTFKVNLNANGGLFKATVDDFADKIVLDFNSTGMSDAKETTRENFQSTTHPNVKYVFSDVNKLAEYKWLFEYMKTEMADHKTSDSYYAEVDEMITKMIDGDTTAISASGYANGRTALRQFIHLIINANVGGNAAYNHLFADYSIEENIAEFEALLPPVETKELILNTGDNLPTPTKEGYNFLGWYDENGNLVSNKFSGEAVNLTAQWEEIVNN